MIAAKPGVTGPLTPLTALTNQLLSAAPLIVTLTPQIIAPAGSVNFGPTTTSASSGLVAIAGGDLPSWQTVGLGSVTLALFTETSTSSNVSGGNLEQTQTTLAYASATVTYTHTEPPGVPEPATMAVLGLGLAAIRHRRRRRED